jgi:hypothetical protein
MKPEKVFKPTIEKIDKLNAGGNFTLNVTHELLNGYIMQVTKSENGFDAQIDFKPFKGFSSSRFNNLNLEPPITIRQEADIYHLPQHSLLLNSYSLTDDDFIRISGGITQISSSGDSSGFDDAFLRIVIPVANGRPKIRDIRGFWYDCDIKTNDSSLVKVFIHEKEYHFFILRNSERTFLVIDSTHKTEFEDFKKVVSNITTAFGFLFGDLFMDEGYFVSSSDSKFSVIDHIFFSTYRDSILSGYAIYTTNPYSVYNVTGQTREEIDAQIEEIKKWYSKLLEFDDTLFSKLCETFYDKEPFSRAAIIVLQGNQLALEIKGSAYSIALEAVTEQILKDKAIKFPKPIEDSGVFDTLRKELLKIVAAALPKSDKTLVDANNIFTNRINDLNRPSNADKLRKPFELLGYTLSKYEQDVIKHRNLFQHGKLPSNPDSEDGVFKDVYYSCMILHRLFYILVLKFIGFEGYIINYPQLHKHITSKDLSEDLLYKI